MHSHLLLLRVWPESLGEGKSEWRGRIQSLHSGEVRHFRDGPTLYQALLRILDDLEADDSTHESTHNSTYEDKEKPE